MTHTEIPHVGNLKGASQNASGGHRRAEGREDFHLYTGNILKFQIFYNEYSLTWQSEKKHLRWKCMILMH